MDYLDPAWFTQCPSLIYLDVSGHRLRTLPSAVASIHTVKFGGNPDLDVAGISEWRDYMKERQKKAMPPQRLKLVLVGQEGAGKTTLLESLRSKNGKANVRKNLSTDGISEETLRFSPQIHRKQQVPLPALTIQCFDFAGQEIYYPSHELFMSRRSLFVVVCSANDLLHGREYAIQRVRYWLEKVKSFVGESRAPVLLVLTQWDLLPRADAKLLRNLPLSEFLGSLELELVGPLPVSCKSGEGIRSLLNAIESLARDPKFFPDVPEYTIQVEAKLRTLTHDEFGRIPISQAELLGENLTRTRTALEYLTSIGAILHFQGTRERPESACYIVRPMALANLFKDILTSRHSFVRKNGKLLESDLFNHIWRSKDELFKGKDPSEEKSKLVDVLEQFELVVRSEPGILLVPSLLPEMISPWYKEFWGTKANEIGRNIQMTFVLKGFFPKLLHRCYHLSVTVELAWRRGVLLTRHDAVGSLMLVERKLSIKVRCDDEKSGIQLFAQLIGVVESVFESYSKGEEWLQLKITVPFRDAEIAFSECIEKYQKGEKSLQIGDQQIVLSKLIPDVIMPHLREINEDQLILGRIIGEGGFGIVYDGTWKGQSVAVKVPKNGTDSERLSLLRDFSREAEVMSRLDHPCLIRFLGMVKFRDLPLPGLVMELVNGGSLEQDFHYPDEELKQLKDSLRLTTVVRKLLSGAVDGLTEIESKKLKDFSPELFSQLSEQNFSPEAISAACQTISNEVTRLKSLLYPKRMEADRKIPLSTRIRLLLDIAFALEFLHNLDPPFVHNDVRSPNVFLLQINDWRRQVAKLADYGLTRVAGGLKMGLATWQWLAPEVLDPRHASTFSVEADIYSFGIVGWEVLNGVGIVVPFEEYEDQYKSKLDLTLAIREKNLRPTLTYADEAFSSEPSYGQLKSLILRCFHSSPGQRPSAAEAVFELKQALGIPADLPKKRTKGLPELRLVANKCFDLRSVTLKSSWTCRCGRTNENTESCECQRSRSSLRITSITWQGQAWFGTTGGVLGKVLGTTAELYPFSQDIHVTALCSDERGVWAATDLELMYIEDEKGSLVPVSEDLGRVVALLPTAGHHAWLIQSNETETTVGIYQATKLVGSLKIDGKIVKAAAGEERLVLASQTELLLYKAEQTVQLTRKIEHPKIPVVALWTGEGKICVASSSEVLHYNISGQLLHRFEMEAVIRSVCNVWVGTTNGIQSCQGGTTGNGEIDCLLSAGGLLYAVDHTAFLLCAYKPVLASN